MPGSFVSSLMRFARGGAVMVASCELRGARGGGTRHPQPATRNPSEQSGNLHPSGHRSQLILHRFIDLARGLVDRGHDEVLQHLHVVGIDGVLLDDDAEEVLRAVHGGLDHATAGAAFDAQLGHAALHLLLHLLDLLQHLLGIHFAFLASTISPPRCFLKACTMGSSRSGDCVASRGAASSATTASTAVGAPKTSAAICSRDCFASLTESAASLLSKTKMRRSPSRRWLFAPER